MTATLADDDALVVSHTVVTLRTSIRTRVITGVVIVVIGLIDILAWGLGSSGGDAAFSFAEFDAKVSIPTVRIPGVASGVVLGAVVVLLGVWQIVRGYTKRQMKWVIGVVILCFALAFMCWAGTGVRGVPDATRNPIDLVGALQQSLIAAIPLILGALSGILCERSGVINVAIEGQLLIGAFAGALFGSAAHNLGIGVVAAVVSGGLVGWLLAVFAIKFLVNQVVLGVVLNTFALGLTNLGYQAFMQKNNNYNSGATLAQYKLPLLGDIPVLGPILFDANLIVYGTYIMIIVVDVGLFRTRWGLRTRAVGEHPKAADTVGIKVLRTRYRNVIIGGLVAGLGGAVFTIGGSGGFNPDTTSGKGFIALAAVIFGRWSPRGAIAAALLFGFTDELQTLLTIVGTPVTIPSAFLGMLPYVATLIAVAGLVGKVQAPAADGEPYTKG
jgi:simple sugar transport system permease protein